MKRSPLLVIFVTVFIDLVASHRHPRLAVYVEGTQFDATRAPSGCCSRPTRSCSHLSPILGRLSDR